MMEPDPQLYSQLFRFHPEWYEFMGAYLPEPDLIEITRATLPDDWTISRDQTWFKAQPPNCDLPAQGWKIHVSSVPSNARQVLSCVSAICVQHGISFKHAVDSRIASALISKDFSREAAGKFVTIYPPDTATFTILIEELREALDGLEGPYILSDRRYKDSKAVHYRYGGIAGYYSMRETGDKEYLLTAPDGSMVPDIRAPYWSPPEWVKDPFQADDLHQDDSDDVMLSSGRYSVVRALNVSVTGGVYEATDLDTGKTVVIKEARPCTAVEQNGNDAVTRLRREYELLVELHNRDVAPEPLNYFEEWEHSFLVEERLNGMDLGEFVIGFSPAARPGCPETYREWYVETLYKLWTTVVNKLSLIHGSRINVGDLSIKNLMITNLDEADVHFIDLEGAWRIDVDEPSGIGTPGFVSPSRSSLPGSHEEVFALGSVFLSSLFPVSNALDLSLELVRPLADALAANVGMPSAVAELITDCTHKDPQSRPALQEVGERLSAIRCRSGNVATDLARESARKGTIIREARNAVSEIARHIVSVADPRRSDRMFPADPLVFFTNPLCVAYGATGVLRALKMMGVDPPAKTVTAVMATDVSASAYTPSLYVGAGGIAWALAELGQVEYAESILGEVL